MNADANGNHDFEDPEPPAQFDAVARPAHYNTGQFVHPECSEPIEVIDITRRLDFCLGNAVKYIMRAGHKGSTIEDLRKAKRYIEYAIEDAASKEETAAILADPETMGAIAEGQADLEYGWTCTQCRRAIASDGKEVCKSCAAEVPKREWPGVISVEYTPTGPDDPWHALMWSERTNGLLSFDELRQVAVTQLGMGHPDGFHLKVKGTPQFVDGHALIAEVVAEGQLLELVRKQPVPAGYFPVYAPTANDERTQL